MWLPLQKGPGGDQEDENRHLRVANRFVADCPPESLPRLARALNGSLLTLGQL